jgi:hypothetical protein
VGIAANLLFPPKVASADAGRAIDGLADSLSELLNRAADELSELVADAHDLAPAAKGWLGEARQITHNIPQVGATLLRAEQGRRLNVRAVGTPNVGPGLRQGLEALEHSAVAIRSMFRAVADATYDTSWLDEESAEDVIAGLTETFCDLAAAVDAFGHVVRGEADSMSRASPEDVQALHDSLEGLSDASARLEDALMAGSTPELFELDAAMLSTVKRLHHEMDLDERMRRQVQMLRRATRPRMRRPRAPARPGRPPAAQEPTPEAETQLLPRLPGDRRDKPRD